MRGYNDNNNNDDNDNNDDDYKLLLYREGAHTRIHSRAAVQGSFPPARVVNLGHGDNVAHIEAELGLVGGSVVVERASLPEPRGLRRRGFLGDDRGRGVGGAAGRHDARAGGRLVRVRVLLLVRYIFDRRQRDLVGAVLGDELLQILRPVDLGDGVAECLLALGELLHDIVLELVILFEARRELRQSRLLHLLKLLQTAIVGESRSCTHHSTTRCTTHAQRDERT